MFFPSGSVGETLSNMRGVWHDQISVYALNGEPLSYDELSGTPGSAPFDNLVYVDFDGENYKQTNVTVRGRPFHVRSFQGKLRDGILYFNHLGPNDPQHIGVAGGPNRLIFSGEKVTDAWQNYAEPDFIELIGHNERSRVTLLYRNGLAVRTLLAKGYRVTPDTSHRHEWDPRGPGLDVHDKLIPTKVFKREE